MSTTDAQVKAIIDTSRDTTPFIATATLLVTEELADKGLSSERLDQITLYLSAHFVCITEEHGGLRRSKLGDGDESYRAPGPDAYGLQATNYGQQAMLLDTSGTLAKVGAGAKLRALFEVV
jgi:hypothetical protein